MLLKYFVSLTIFRKKIRSVLRCSSQWLYLCIFYQLKDILSFRPNIDISNFSMPGNADVNIELPNSKFPEVSDIDLSIIPKSGITINQYRKKYRYKVSGFAICQTYKISATFKTKPICNNLKINPLSVEFPIRQINRDESCCLYNQSHIMITMNSVIQSEFYVSINLLNKTFHGNFTSTLTISTKELEAHIFQNFAADISLCTRRCRKCGVKRSFICYFKNTPSASNYAKGNRFCIIRILVFVVAIYFSLIFGVVVIFENF